MNVLARLPAGITNTQSYTWVLRETFLATLQPLFPGYTFLRNNQDRVQVWQLPVLGVYLVSEKMVPDGDWNAGDVRFIHDFQIGFSVIIANNDSDLVEQKLDAAFWTVMYGLWPNLQLMNMLYSTTPDNTRFEGVMLGTRRHSFGATGKDNETPVAELQYEITCRYRTEWPPVIIDDLKTIHVTVVPVGIDPTQTQVIEAEYDFAASG